MPLLSDVCTQVTVPDGQRQHDGMEDSYTAWHVGTLTCVKSHPLVTLIHVNSEQ